MNTDAVLTILPGMTVFLFLMGLYKTVLEKKVQAKENIQQLLGAKQAAKPAILRQQEEIILKRRNKNEKSQLYQLEMKLERANLLVKPNEFLLICVGAALGSGILFYLMGQNLLMILIAAACGFGAPHLYLVVRIWLRMKKASEQLADVLDALVNCFKTGYGFSRAIQMVADNYDDPWGTEFGKMAAEMNLGSTQDDALFGLANRIPSTDVDLFVTALLIQKETGGNMAELLGTLSKTIRERYKLFRKVGAISAQGKLSASIVICVPFFLMAVMYLFLPGPVTEFITNPVGVVMMIIAGIWMVMGIGVLYKIVQIEV